MLVYPTYSEYRKAWNNAEKVTPPIPLNLDIELSTACNLKCPFCFKSNPKLKNNSKNPHMSFATAIRIITEAAKIGIPAIKFNWRGESTLHPDFVQILGYAGGLAQFHDIIINTNGNYESYKMFGLAHCTKVIFSLDSFKPEIYIKMRVGGILGRVLTNIRQLLNHSKSTKIIVRRVITELNKNDDFKADCKKYFGNAVECSEHYAFDRSSKTNKNLLKIQRVYCGYPSQRLVIDYKGDVFPCCVDYFEKMKIGSIHKNTLEYLWSCIYIHTLRNKLKSNTYTNTCKYCTSWASYLCEKRDFVKK